MADALRELRDTGVAVWLDDLSRAQSPDSRLRPAAWL
jgi:hypothetical protein